MSYNTISRRDARSYRLAIAFLIAHTVTLAIGWATAPNADAAESGAGIVKSAPISFLTPQARKGTTVKCRIVDRKLVCPKGKKAGQ